MTERIGAPALAIIILALASCRGVSSNSATPWQTVQFPVLAEKAAVGPLGMVGGRLVRQGPCLLLVDDEGRQKTLPVWPHGSMFHPGPGILRGPDGRIVARLGEQVLGTGGESTYDVLQEATHIAIPRNCDGEIVYALIWTFELTPP